MPTALAEWSQFATRDFQLTHQARVGIAAASRAYGVGRGDEILVPAYNCGTEIDALLSCGASLRFYRVDRQARIDLQDLCRRMNGRTRVVYVIHYFGWPQPLGELATWCRERGILLFEDCALSLFSGGEEGPLGRAGDSAFFSFPKTLSTPDGGAWTWSAGGALKDPMRCLHKPPLRRIIRRCLPLLKRAVLNELGVVPGSEWIGKISLRRRGLPAAASAPRADMPASYYYDACNEDCRISSLTGRLLRWVRPEDVIARRRANYLRLVDAVADMQGISLLFPALPADVCPLGFPVIMPDRKRWSIALCSRGIPAVCWWEGYHRAFDWTGFDEARFLKDNLLVLPVHQSMPTALVDRMIDVMRSCATRGLSFSGCPGDVTTSGTSAAGCV